MPHGSTKRVTPIRKSSHELKMLIRPAEPNATKAYRTARRRKLPVEGVICCIPYARPSACAAQAERRTRFRSNRLHTPTGSLASCAHSDSYPGPVLPQSIKNDDRSKMPPKAVSQSKTKLASAASSPSSESQLLHVVPIPLSKNPPVSIRVATVLFRRMRETMFKTPHSRETKSYPLCRLVAPSQRHSHIQPEV